MAKIYAQGSACMWGSTDEISAAGSTGGSMDCAGYARIVGLLYTSASLKAASGLRISQSADRGSNWDYHTNYVPGDGAGSAFSIELVGNAVKVVVRCDSAASLRTVWHLRPV